MDNHPFTKENSTDLEKTIEQEERQICKTEFTATVLENRYEELNQRLDGVAATMKELKERMKLLPASSKIKKSPNGYGGELEAEDCHVDITNKACFDTRIVSSSSQSPTVIDKNVPEDMKNSLDYENGGHVLSVDIKTECCKLKPMDVWEPGTSNMLQYLVFLQSLFNRKPKLNDIMYNLSVSRDKLIGPVYTELDALIYNESTYISSLKTIVSIIKKPPNKFEDFMVGHFHNRAVDIVKAYEAYAQGVQVGCLVKGALDEGNKGIFSITFKDDLDSCIKPLVTALNTIRAKVD
ncbi:hypothetical protein L1987_57033 [Smallanthus sonchifolius]|uniref:Uncharacterized protein n=1 Tax=Smallanthus sonchifolius TaxID=185202 RepID=A0ACB9DBX2_9ASTR|nr:hypothetical protein L1987_57033 [Smallanthus sonchifolius]